MTRHSLTTPTCSTTASTPTSVGKCSESRTSENSVWAKFARPTPVSWGAGGGYAKTTGSNAGAETGRRPLLVPPARLSCALSQGLWAPSMQLSGHCDPRRAEGAQEKARRPRRGEIRAAGPYNSSLPDYVQAKHRGQTSQINSYPQFGEQGH